MKQRYKRLLSWVLTVAMVLSMVPAMTLTAGAADGWDSTGTLLDWTLNAGEAVSMDLHVPEGIPDRCVIASRESDEGLLSDRWAAQYDSGMEAGVPRVLFASWG